MTGGRKPALAAGMRLDGENGEKIGDGGGAGNGDTPDAENDGAGSRRGERGEMTARAGGARTHAIVCQLETTRERALHRAIGFSDIADLALSSITGKSAGETTHRYF